MESGWTRTTLASLDAAGLAAAFNTAYTDYVIALTMNPEQATRHVGVNDIVLDHSPLWLDETGAVVAMAALGVRGQRGWIGGFGVAPSYRGRGLAHALVAETLAGAARLGLREVWLEVLVNNPHAIRVYERAGFRTIRDLRVLRRPVDTRSVAPETRLVEANAAELLANRTLVGPTRPAWQFEPASLRRFDGLAAFGAAERPADGFVVYRPTPASVQVLDLHVHAAETAAGLLQAVTRAHPNLPIHRTNEPAVGPAADAFDRLGWVEVARQHEMRWVQRKPDV